MKVTQSPPVFRPITIVLESEDERNKLFYVLKCALKSQDNNLAALAATRAKEFLDLLNELENQND